MNDATPLNVETTQAELGEKTLNNGLLTEDFCSDTTKSSEGNSPLIRDKSEAEDAVGNNSSV